MMCTTCSFNLNKGSVPVNHVEDDLCFCFDIIIYVHVYECKYVCKFVSMHARMCVLEYICIYLSMYGWMYARVYALFSLCFNIFVSIDINLLTCSLSAREQNADSIHHSVLGKDNKGANGDSNTNHFNGSKGASVLNSPTNASPVQQVRDTAIERKRRADRWAAIVYCISIA